MTGMTLAEAQALECNRCGDCCDSRRAFRSTDGRLGWGLGPRRPDHELIPLIPLRMVHEGVFEQALPVPAAMGSGDPFTCGALQPQPDGTANCGMHNAQRADVCGSFPVFGAHGEDIERRLAASPEQAVWTQARPLPRCTWAEVWIVPDPPQA